MPSSRVASMAWRASEMLSSRVLVEARGRVGGKRLCACLPSGPLRSVRLSDRDHRQRARDEGGGREDGDEATKPRAIAARSAPRARAAAPPPPAPVALIDARLQVRAFGSPDRQVRGRGPGLELVQPGTPQGGSSGRRRSLATRRPAPGQAFVLTEVLSGVVDPRSQPSPGAQQRLVGDLDRGLPGGGFPIEREEPVAPEGVHARRRSPPGPRRGRPARSSRRGAACPAGPPRG